MEILLSVSLSVKRANDNYLSCRIVVNTSLNCYTLPWHSLPAELFLNNTSLYQVIDVYNQPLFVKHLAFFFFFLHHILEDWGIKS